jgi:hypothetical protein
VYRHENPSILSVDEDSIIYYETFEEGSGGWESTDLTDPGHMWHRDTYNAYSGQSWWCGSSGLSGYDNNWLQYLVTPVLDLSGATDPTLTFKLYFAIEEPSIWGEYDGWDGCNVWISATGGNTWIMLDPTYPAYICQNLYSFGWRWEMGRDIPGWAGFSGDWIDAEFSLAGYTVQNIQLRFAFSSDEATCTATNPTLVGSFIDDVEIRDGAVLYLANDADGTFYPAEFTMSAGEPYGDYWSLTEESYHSPSHSWNCDDQDLLSDALTSPTIPIPVEMSTTMSYWVYCDMPDWNGDGDEFLDDYYVIELAPEGSAIWTELVYDWAHDGSQLQWVERTYGYMENLPTDDIDLTPWAGQEVRLRFRVITDDNDDGGNGTGLYIDDVTLLSSELPGHDTGASRLMIPFPTYSGQPPIDCSVDIVNYGSINQSQVPAFWDVNGETHALLPWSQNQVNAGQTTTREFEWEPPAEGSYTFTAFTNLVDDEDETNDTCYAGVVEVTPTGVFEFGYDHRQISYMLEFYSFNFAAGNGAMVYFTPEADGVPGILDGEYVKALFYSEGTFNLHVFSAGSPGNPGLEVYSRSVTIGPDDVYPNWAEIDISNVQYLQGGHPDFWIWFEITAPDNTPHIIGHTEDSYTPGHFFVYDGLDAYSTLVNFNIRAIMTGTTSVEPENPHAGSLEFGLMTNYPNPFNPSTRIQIRLPQRSYISLDVFDLMGRHVGRLFEGWKPPGQHEYVWNAEDQPSGIYWLWLQDETRTASRKMILLK